MNKYTVFVATLILVAVLAFIAGKQAAPDAEQATDTDASVEHEVLYWVAPMDPAFRREEPGKSPMGMDLVPVYADQVDSQPGVVSIDPVVVNNLGVRTAVAERGPLPRLINTVGYVSYDEDTVHHIHSRVDGWVEKLGPNASGESVKKGQLLFELYSPLLVSAQEEYLSAARSKNTSLRKASRNRLVALGVTASEIVRLESERSVRQRVPVYAASDGVIAKLGVRHGMFVTPATEIMSIANLDTVWVLAEVLERQATWVEAGQTASVSFDYLPGTVIKGKIDYVYPELDPKTRTLRVRLRFDNNSMRLRPNMFAHVTIEGQKVGAVVHVPREALIRGGVGNRVVVDLGEGRYVAKRVLVGIESGDRIAIRRGLSAGDRVVTSAQFLIDSESNIDSALGRMDATQ
jgi:Cu(I)/Ag(I) efflux system membrane fusion protein